jgi:serine/threonine protein kinase
MKASTFFKKDNKPSKSGGEAVVKSGKLYILTDSGITAKPRIATRLARSKRDQDFETRLHEIAKTSETLLPSFYVDDEEYVLFAKTGVITHYPLLLPEINTVFWDLQHGIKTLHEEGLVHRDIKPDNIVLRDNGLPALIDFGVSDYADTKKVGETTLVYAPPEYVDDQKRYRPKAHDIWSFALSMLELAAPKAFKAFKEAIPTNLSPRIRFLEEKYREENVANHLAPLLAEVRTNNRDLANLIEPLLCFDPVQRELNFEAQSMKPLKKIVDTLPLPKHDESSIRKFILQLNYQIKGIKDKQKAYQPDSRLYQRLEYQITVCRDQREQAYFELSKIKAEPLPNREEMENWNPNKETQELDKLKLRFTEAEEKDKTRIAFKIIRAADMWLFENQNSPKRKSVQHLLRYYIDYVKKANTSLRYEAFSEIIQSKK